MTSEQQIDPSSHVDHFLKKVQSDALIQGIFTLNMSRPRDRAVWKEGNYSRWREGDRFIKKLFAIAHRRVLPVPVSPDDGRERTLAFRHDEIRGHDTAFRTVVCDVINSCVRAPLNADLLDS